MTSLTNHDRTLWMYEAPVPPIVLLASGGATGKVRMSFVVTGNPTPLSFWYYGKSVTVETGVWLNHTWHYGRWISSINFRALQIRSDGLEEWNIEFGVLARGIGLRSGGQTVKKLWGSDICESFFLVLLAAKFCENVPGGNYVKRSVMFRTKYHNTIIVRVAVCTRALQVGVGRRGRVECVLILGGKWALWRRDVSWFRL